jgi:hypothetical protein
VDSVITRMAHPNPIRGTEQSKSSRYRRTSRLRARTQRFLHTEAPFGGLVSELFRGYVTLKEGHEPFSSRGLGTSRWLLGFHLSIESVTADSSRDRQQRSLARPVQAKRCWALISTKQGYNHERCLYYGFFEPPVRLIGRAVRVGDYV